LLVPAALGCISTDVDPPATPILCSGRAADVLEATVLVTTRLSGTDFRVCSGVLVAPRLVVTGLGCVASAVDAEADDPRNRGAPAPDFIIISLGTVGDYGETCNRDDGWSAIRDGSFGAELGVPVPPEAISVGKIPFQFFLAAEQPVAVGRVFTSLASTYCDESLAVLELQTSLDASPAPVRLEEASRANEAVNMAGYCVGDTDFLEPGSNEASTEMVTFERAEPGAPPRSLVVSGARSLFSTGGGVFSTESGALLGVITSGMYFGCNEQEDGARSLAVRLAPYRQLLLEAAMSTGQALKSERRADQSSAQQAPPCDGTVEVDEE
jgi:hypothetical protein